MLSTIPGATADSVLYAVDQGWLELEGAHSACSATLIKHRGCPIRSDFSVCDVQPILLAIARRSLTIATLPSLHLLKSWSLRQTRGGSRETGDCGPDSQARRRA